MLSGRPGFIRRTRKRGRRAQGVKYEARGHEYFEGVFGERYVQSPWFKFLDGGETRYCEADALLFDLESGTITIVEFKYQHTIGAWWQLERLYKPIVQKVFGDDWGIGLVEVVKWFDPSVDFPAFKMAKDIDSIRAGELGVHIWKP